LSIARRLRLPRRIVVALEGEGLANDATALILYRFAVAAVGAGVFSLGHAIGVFAAIVAGEVAWGVAVGWLLLRLRRWVADPSIEILLSILTPFIAYWPPEQLGGSGVLATMATGLYFSWNGPGLISAATRLQGIFFWDVLIYVIEGMVFLITGLQAHHLIAAIGAYPGAQLAASAALVALVVIAARFAWIYPATYLPRRLAPRVWRRRAPTWREPFTMAFIGVRGIVSLAAALAIPTATQAGAPFPHRDLILFLVFCTILVTLVGQGLMLPAVVGWLGLGPVGEGERAAERAEEFSARRRAIATASARLEQLRRRRQLPDAVVRAHRGRSRERLDELERRIGEDARLAGLDDDVERALVLAERQLINAMHRRGEVKDAARRRIERDLDLREAHLANLDGDG
jgi:CPA1 family monovalent cation:H+ antiporter